MSGCRKLYPATIPANERSEFAGVVLKDGTRDTRVSYNGYYFCFPSRRSGFDSRHPLQIKI